MRVLTVGSWLRLILFAMMVLAGSLLLQPSWGQIISGNLVGTVLDKGGSAIPNASVVAVNVGTRLTYKTTANASGEYAFNNLPVGSYNISASAASFATTTIDRFNVELNKTGTLNVTLDITGTTTTVEVNGIPPTLDTTTAQLGQTFQGQQIADFPTTGQGSGVLNLSLLSAGVATGGGLGVGTGPSVAGQRTRNNDFTIEGVDNNNKSVTGPLVRVPDDAVAEFSFLQNQFSPEFGHSSGGQFNTVVKSGTNQYHGLAYAYNQNRNYNALDTLQRLEGFTQVPRFDQNRFGGQLGGPVLKNKLFFFGNFEYQPLGQAGGAGSVCAPTAAGFSTINATPGLSSTNVNIFEKYVEPGTLPNAACKPIAWVNSTTLPTAGLAVVAPSYENSKFLTTSIDYDISAKDQIRGRYIYNSIVGIDNTAQLPAFFLPRPQKFHLVALNEYHTFTPTLTNEFRLGFNRFTNNLSSGSFSFPGLDSFPNLQFVDLGNLQVGPNSNAPQFTIQNTYSVADQVNWTKVSHSLTFGVEGRKLIAPESFTQRVRGDYQYNATLSYFEDQIPDHLAERSNGNTIFYGDQAALYWYVNDNWRIRPNFTANLGIRYEYTTIPFTQRLQNLNAQASVPGLINFASPQPATSNWGPRIGFAYSPGTSGRTSIRVGAGIAYDVLFDNLGLLSLPPELSSTIDCAPVGNDNCPTAFLAGGGIKPGPGGFTTFPTVAAARAATSAFVPVNQKDPKSIDWTLGVQHSFANDYTVEVRYIGDRGIHLPAQIQLNKRPKVTSSFFLPTFTTAPSQATLNAEPIDLAAIEAVSASVPAYASAGFVNNITAYEPWASSTYHGLAAQLTKRMSYGLQFIAGYTYSHAIDDATAEVFSTVLAPRRPEDFQNLAMDRSNSLLDHRHRGTLALIYDEPYLRTGNAFLRNTLGNWEFAPIYTYQSPQWFTAQDGIDSNLNGDAAPDRPIFNASGVPGIGTGVIPLCNNTVATCPTALTGKTGALNNPHGVVGYLATNPNAQFIQAGYGALANVGRNTLQLNPINDIDLTAAKRFTITERFNVQFQARFYNVLNHPQYVGGFLNDVRPPNPTFTGAQLNMLLPSNPDFNKPSTVFASNARTMQLVLKFNF